ncbi:MAG: ABC transporter ATP-binding protein, partial [Patescibacteria group bacterium]
MQNFTKQTLKIFWRHAKRYPLSIIGIFAGIIFYTASVNYVSILYRDLINLLAEALPDAVEAGIRLVVIIFILNFLRILAWRGANFLNNYFQSSVMRDLMNTCYQYLHHHSIGFFNSSFVGSLVTKVKRYERAFEQIADQFTFELGRSLFEVAVIIGIIFWQYPSLGWIFIVWCFVFMTLAYIYAIFKLPYDIRRAGVDTKVTGQLADSITNNINIKLFTNYERENQSFHGLTREQLKIRKKSWDLGTLGDLIQALFMIIIELIVMYYAVKGWQAGAVLVGDIALLQIFLIRIFDKLWNTGKNIRVIYEALADANEMTEILLKPHEIQDQAHARTFTPGIGKIEFKNVSFGYHRENSVLDDFDLPIHPGERVAFVGPSGGGKSTIAKLLFRFYDVDGGEILIDGQNIKTVTQDSLRKAISLVPQEPILFHRSLMENIRYARPDASDDEVVRVAKLAHAHEFIESFPMKYETLVGERGLKLSGGERQRVAIARAILKNAPILVLDEA